MQYVKKIGVATVFFNPTLASVKLFISLADYGYRVAVGNNGIDEQSLELINKSKNIILIGDGLNVGLAKAMNDAIGAIFNNSTEIDSVILFDQDSKPDIDLPVQLRSSYFAGCDQELVACLGPSLRDEKSNKKIEMDQIRYKNVLSLATSGTFITRKKFTIVGPLKEDFFIDCLDHEWCFRAKNMGFKIVCDNHLIMTHNMGEDGLDWFGSFKPIYRSPIRHYYIVRNTLAMIATSYAPTSWRIIEAFKLIRRIAFYILLSENRSQTIYKIGEAFVFFIKNCLNKCK